MGKDELRVRRRRACRAPALAGAMAFLQLSVLAAAPGCVLARKETRIDVLGEERLPVGLGTAGMRTDYGALTRGEVALRFEGEAPCRVRVVETYEKITDVERKHTKASWYIYAGVGGAGVATAATGLGLGLDSTTRNNNVANGLLSYSLYVIAGTAVVFAANMIRSGRFERKEGPFRRARVEPLADCGPASLAGAAVTVALPTGARALLHADDAGVASFSPFALVDAFADAHADTVFRVTVETEAIGAHSFDFGLTAAVMRAAAERYIAERGLRKGPPPTGSSTSPAGDGSPLVASLESARDEESGRVTVSLRVRNGGATPTVGVRGRVVAGPPGLAGRWLYAGDLKPGAERADEVTLAAELAPPGTPVSVELLTAAGPAMEVAGTL